MRLGTSTTKLTPGVADLTSRRPPNWRTELAIRWLPRLPEGRTRSKPAGRTYAPVSDLKADPTFPIAGKGHTDRTMQALAMIAEVVHGAPCRFSDPARFSFAHGGKDRHPFPVPVRVYDETIAVLKSAVQKARLGQQEEL